MKPRIIILGGCGFIGRNLVDFLVREDLVEEIRVIDKVPPQMAWLSDAHKQSFDDPRVHFKSANLINSGSCAAAFARDDDLAFDFAVNCACESRCGQSSPVYKEGIHTLSLGCAGESVKAGVKRFLEFSSGNMASSKQEAHKETDKTEPWTNVARWKRKVEEDLAKIPGLDYVVLRPAIVYGPSDKTGLMRLLIIGAIYQHLRETMKLMWSRNLTMNTVHVRDVCRAVWFLLHCEGASGQICNVVDEGKTTQGLLGDLVAQLFDIDVGFVGTAISTVASICNIVDEGKTTQGLLGDLVAQLFDIDVGFVGTAISTVANTDPQAVADEVNDKHLGPWAEMCDAAGIVNTPLFPVVDAETLSKKHLHLDGSKLKEMGFQYSHPVVNTTILKEIVTDYINMKIFPPVAMS